MWYALQWLDMVFLTGHAKKGWNVDRMGRVAAKLMEKLGYSGYGAQGGDWGAGVTSWLGRNDAEHVVGIHLNMVGVGAPDDNGRPRSRHP